LESNVSPYAAEFRLSERHSRGVAEVPIGGASADFAATEDVAGIGLQGNAVGSASFLASCRRQLLCLLARSKHGIHAGTERRGIECCHSKKAVLPLNGVQICDEFVEDFLALFNGRVVFEVGGQCANSAIVIGLRHGVVAECVVIDLTQAKVRYAIDAFVASFTD